MSTAKSLEPTQGLWQTVLDSASFGATDPLDTIRAA